MSIKVKDRIPKTSDMGIPCSICIRAERIRHTINRGQHYLNKRLRKEKEDFLNQDSVKQLATDRANVQYDLRKKYNKKEKPISMEKLVRIELGRLWKPYRIKLELGTKLGEQLNILRKLLSGVCSSHSRCVGCSIGFGEKHLDSPVKTKIGKLCSNCYKLFLRFGPSYFKAEEEEEV